MVELLTGIVFAAVAGVTAALGLRFWGPGSRAVERLAVRSRRVSPYLHSPGLVWQELVRRIGSLVPDSPKDLPRLRRRLIRAGFRDPAAVRFFHGTRAVTTVGFAAVGLTAGLRSGSTIQNLLLVAGAATVAGYLAPSRVLLWRIGRRQRRIEKALPSTLDLMVVCVESGLGLDQTTIQVARELQSAYPELCDEFAVMNLEMRAGKRRAEALHNLAERTGVEELKKLVAVLIQTDRFGTSIGQTLRGHSEYLRVIARQRAEERAAKLAVKLVFPIFFCVLPSLFVVTVGPVLTRLVRDLIPAIENM